MILKQVKFSVAEFMNPDTKYIFRQRCGAEAKFIYYDETLSPHCALVVKSGDVIYTYSKDGEFDMDCGESRLDVVMFREEEEAVYKNVYCSNGSKADAYFGHHSFSSRKDAVAFGKINKHYVKTIKI